jgi:hypothetical protein
LPSTILTGWTAEELLSAAAKESLPASKRLIVDWTGLGLLDRPNRRGRGRGGGSQPGTWPEEQRQLFLTLLRQRSGIKHVVPLLNIPVALWLIWGDDYVPLRQARRALESWITMSWNTSKAGARRTARQFVDSISDPKAGGANRKALLDALANGMASPNSFDREHVLTLVRRVFDPRGTGTPRGPVGAEITAEGVVNVLQARTQAFLRFSDVSDELLIWSRKVYRHMNTMYAADLPHLMRDPEYGHQHTKRGIEERVNAACVDFLTTLGLVLLSEESDGPEGALYDRRRSQLVGMPEVMPNL